MAALLDNSRIDEIGVIVKEFLEENDYRPEEIIPALMKVVGEMSLLTEDSEQALDEGIRILEKFSEFEE